MKLKTRSFSKTPLVWGMRLLLGGIFVYASWHKILDPAGFAKIIYGYGLFPAVSINLLAIWIPFLELLAGACLILGVMPRGGVTVINGMLVLFILVIAFNLLRGHEFDCGCFSLSDNGSRAAAVWLLVRDAGMLGAGLFLWRDLAKSVS